MKKMTKVMFIIIAALAAGGAGLFFYIKAQFPSGNALFKELVDK